MRNRVPKALISGFAGALAQRGVGIVLNRKYNSNFFTRAKRAISQKLSKFKFANKYKKKYFFSRFGDVLKNTFYFSMVSAGKKSLISGPLLGLTKGTGVAGIPTRKDLKRKLTMKNIKEKLITLSAHLSGGLTSGIIYKFLGMVGKT